MSDSAALKAALRFRRTPDTRDFFGAFLLRYAHRQFNGVRRRDCAEDALDRHRHDFEREATGMIDHRRAGQFLDEQRPDFLIQVDSPELGAGGKMNSRSERTAAPDRACRIDHQLAEMILAVGEGKWRFFVHVNGNSVWVVVAVSRYGNKYLKTEADGEQPDNLLSLPECP